MATVKKSVTITQYFNPAWYEGCATLPEYCYKVGKLVNLVDPPIGKTIYPTHVDELIAAGITVTIVPVKD